MYFKVSLEYLINKLMMQCCFFVLNELVDFCEYAAIILEFYAFEITVSEKKRDYTREIVNSIPR